jgi:hypothetical protein
MAVRVRVQVSQPARPRARAIETVAPANSGFESAAREVLLPVRVAERLGLWPPPRGARMESFDSPAAEYLLTIPYAFFSVKVLELDPAWDPLRGHPRYRMLVEKYRG